MSKFKNKPVRINLVVDIDLRRQYKKYCIDKDYNLSERIRQLIEKDLKGEIK